MAGPCARAGVAICAAAVIITAGACTNGDGPDRSSPSTAVRLPRSSVARSPSPQPIAPMAQTIGSSADIGSPESDGDVSGGGPADPSAAQVTAAQLPTLDPAGYDAKDGIPGYQYLKQIVGYTPAGPVFDQIDAVAQCALQLGVFSFRALGLKAPPPTPWYRYDALGGVLVIAVSRLTSLQFLLGCLPGVTGGGAGAVNPCFRVLRYASIVYGITDTYIAVIFGTQPRICDDSAGFYARFRPEVLA